MSSTKTTIWRYTQRTIYLNPNKRYYCIKNISFDFYNATSERPEVSLNHFEPRTSTLLTFFLKSHLFLLVRSG
jgi:hypothetical protein